MQGVSASAVVLVLVVALLGYYAGDMARVGLMAAERELALAQRTRSDLLAALNTSRREQQLLKDNLLQLQTRAIDLGKGLFVAGPAGADAHAHGHDISAAPVDGEVAPLRDGQPSLKLWKSSAPLDVLRSRMPCRDAVSPVNADLPIYVFVAGVEGAGHHALETVWRGLQQYYDLHMIGYNPGLHSFAKDRDVDRAYQFPTIDFERYKGQIQRFLAKPDISGKRLVIDSRNSYPEGFGVGALAHPDLVYLSQLDGVLFDLRVLVVLRDPVDCVMSAVRRFQVKEFQYKNPQFQARAVQESLSMINNAVHTLPCGKVLALPYEEFVTTPRTFSQDLAQLVGVRKVHMDRCLTEVRSPSEKTYTPEQQQMRDQLRTFFQQQSVLWPLLSKPSLLPRVNIGRGPVSPASARAQGGVHQQHQQQEEEGRQHQQEQPASDKDAPHSTRTLAPVAEDKFLRINYFLHLGFNNVRFIMEIGFLMANSLNRQLLLPDALRMRRCVNPDLCAAAPCKPPGKSAGHYWCPLEHFLDVRALEENGARLARGGMDAFAKGKSVKVVKSAFVDVYDKQLLWLDRIPAEVQAAMDNAQSGTMTYHRFHLGCELSYFKVVHDKWTYTQDNVRSFPAQFAAEEDVLYLDGTPHNIGLTPFFWGREDDARFAPAAWQDALVYALPVRAYARAIAEEVQKRSKVGTFVCVHLRRGDFVDAGWLGNAEDLSYVEKRVGDLLGEGEGLYLATDELDGDKLRGLRELGALQWNDMLDTLQQVQLSNPDGDDNNNDNNSNSNRKYNEAARALLGFEDYIGLIEQQVCGLARAFIGSKCSSFTGGILNIRRARGDSHYLHF